MAFYNVPVNLPHAATLANRIELRLNAIQVFEHPESEHLGVLIENLQEVLGRYEGANDPSDHETQEVVKNAAAIGRNIVDQIEHLAAVLSCKAGNQMDSPRSIQAAMEVESFGTRVGRRVLVSIHPECEIHTLLTEYGDHESFSFLADRQNVKGY